MDVIERAPVRPVEVQGLPGRSPSSHDGGEAGRTRRGTIGVCARSWALDVSRGIEPGSLEVMSAIVERNRIRVALASVLAHFTAPTPTIMSWGSVVPLRQPCE